MASARKAATNDSSSVAGKRSAISRDTFARLAQAQTKFALGCVDQEMAKPCTERFVQPQAARAARIWSGVAS